MHSVRISANKTSNPPTQAQKCTTQCCNIDKTSSMSINLHTAMLPNAARCVPFAVPPTMSLGIAFARTTPRLFCVATTTAGEFIDRWLESGICLCPHTHNTHASCRAHTETEQLFALYLTEIFLFFSLSLFATQFSSFQNFQPLCCWSFALLAAHTFDYISCVELIFIIFYVLLLGPRRNG